MKPVLLYLRAKADRLVPPRALEEIRCARSGIEVREFDGPHCLLRVRPAETAVAVAAFIHRL